MRFTKRILPAVAVLGITALTAGCAGGAAPTEEGGTVEITYWLWQDDATDGTWTELAEEFNSSQDDVEVTLETIPLDQYQNQLVSSAMNGTGPDAARSKDWWLGQFAPEGAIADLSPYIDEWEASDDVVDSLWATGQIPGEDAVYMLPHQYTTLYLYYRVDYFEALGLDAPQTQQDLLDAAEALTGDGRYGIDVRGGAGGQDQWLAWMYAGGASVVDDSGEVVLDDETAVSVNEDYLSIVNDLEAAPPGSITAAFADVKTNFVEGLTGMMIHHPGSLKELEGVFGDKLGVVPIPTADGEPGATLGSMSGNVIMAGSEKQDAAWAWISWLTEEAQVDQMSASPQGQLPVLESVIDSEAYSSDPNLKVAVDAIPTAKTWPALAGVAELAAKEWNPIIQKAFQGELTSQDALTSMADVLR
ncbi:sugar ABC transporter substrate-binding protein [Microbacterium sp. LWH13-1.2]|uniref:ABC transporter substrate-binding protein n=1 Tax=Microbacterium sp. LWH13-1.2 TaxID=3135260 RepID=UPI00313A0B2B